MDSIDDYFSKYINITNNSNDRIKTTDLFNSYSVWLMKNSDRFTSQTYNQISCDYFSF